MSEEKIKRIVKTTVASLIAMFAIIVVIGSIYTVDEQSQAVVTTFGKVTAVQGAGLKFKVPFIQRVKQVPVNMTQKISIGYEYDSQGNMAVLEDESRIMTGDDNIVNVDFFIEWKISDPVSYLYNSNNPVSILKVLAQSSARNIIGSELVDEVLTTGKERIQTAIEDTIRDSLNEFNIGIQVIDVKIQDAEPPNASVSAAFKAVEDAKLQKDTLITEANTYKEQQLPQAQSKADKLIRDAEAYYQSRVLEATGEIERFNSIYEEYSKYPETSKARMYLELLEKILPNMDIYINTTEGGTSTLIPIKDMVNIGGNSNG